MKISKCFAGQYVKAADLEGEVRATIDRILLERMPSTEDEKPVAYFTDFEQSLVLNKTNASTIADAYGDDTRSWIGKPVVLYPTTTQFGGKMVPCVRVRVPAPRGPEDPDIDAPF